MSLQDASAGIPERLINGLDYSQLGTKFEAVTSKEDVHFFPASGNFFTFGDKSFEVQFSHHFVHRPTIYKAPGAVRQSNGGYRYQCAETDHPARADEFAFF